MAAPASRTRVLLPIALESRCADRTATLSYLLDVQNSAALRVKLLGVPRSTRACCQAKPRTANTKRKESSSALLNLSGRHRHGTKTANRCKATSNHPVTLTDSNLSASHAAHRRCSVTSRAIGTGFGVSRAAGYRAAYLHCAVVVHPLQKPHPYGQTPLAGSKLPSLGAQVGVEVEGFGSQVGKCAVKSSKSRALATVRPTLRRRWHRLHPGRLLQHVMSP